MFDMTCASLEGHQAVPRFHRLNTVNTSIHSSMVAQTCSQIRLVLLLWRCLHHLG
ncbi:hypothetical protein X992_5506 [Burkholderia pseudomallei MSHR5492]|nr:hypothetical protein X992_5506 [Burkholderia pseudomallei MSHR5492]